MSAWYEDDGFWTAFYPAMFHESRWAAAEEEVGAALGLMGISAPVDVLDFCCGPGRHAIALAREGHRVMGVDRTESYLEIARQKAQEAGVALTFEAADVRVFKREAAFDVAISLYTSFGYFEDPADDQKVLANIYASLRPGGQLLMDMSGKEIVARAFQSRSWTEPEPGLLFLEDRTVESGWERIHNRWRMIRNGKMVEQEFSVRVYSGVELKAVMLAAGFSEVHLCGTLDGGPYDHTARRLVAVGVK